MRPPTPSPDGGIFDAPDADIILRALGPPKRNFRVCELVHPYLTRNHKYPFSTDLWRFKETECQRWVEIGTLTLPMSHASGYRLANYASTIIYPLPSDKGFNNLAKCLTIVGKYDIKGARSQLCAMLTWINTTYCGPARVL